jgi:hypothetical protein
MMTSSRLRFGALALVCLIALALVGCSLLSGLFGLKPTAEIKDGDRTVAVGALSNSMGGSAALA